MAMHLDAQAELGFVKIFDAVLAFGAFDPLDLVEVRRDEEEVVSRGQCSACAPFAGDVDADV